MESPALELKQLSKKYGEKYVVKDLSFSIKRGEIFGLLGPNGAGKSTTINMLAGATMLSSGSAEIFGHDTEKEYFLTRRLTGVMHQEVLLDNFFTVDQTLRIQSGYHGFRDDPEWRQLLLDRLDLAEHADKKPIKLSGGMKRRFMVAKALIHKPNFVILDEPTAGVDVELRKGLWTFVKEINDQGVTVLLTTHYLEEAEEMCDRIAILHHGELLALENKHTLINKFDCGEFVIKLSSSLSKLPESHKHLNVEISPDGFEIRFRTNQHFQTKDVLAIIPSLQLDIKDIEVKKPDLEDVFLDITGTGEKIRTH